MENILLVETGPEIFAFMIFKTQTLPYILLTMRFNVFKPMRVKWCA
jgi:hypothetical protein